VYALNQIHQSSIAKISTKIKNYQHFRDNNILQIIDFMPFYQSALTGDLTLFKKLRTNIEKIFLENKVTGEELKNNCCRRRSIVYVKTNRLRIQKV
jgi:hypothetical protein